MILENNFFIRIPEFWFSGEILSEIWFFLSVWVIATIVRQIMVFLFQRTTYSKTILLMTAPGVIIHELSHITACLLTGVKVSRIKLFDPETGGGRIYAENIKEKTPLVAFLISFAPLISGSAIIYYATKYLESANIAIYWAVLFTWIILSVICSVGPSFQDLRVFFQSISLSYKKTLRDIGVILFSLLIYAAIGENSAFFLGEVVFTHFIFILGIILLLNTILKLIVKILSTIIGDLSTNKNNQLIRPMVKVNSWRSRRRKFKNNTGYTGYRHSLIQKSEKSNRKEKEDFYDSLIDEFL